jgi:hypothetical protein
MKPGDPVNIGDFVVLRRGTDAFYDWRSVPPQKEYGYYLRDPKDLRLLNGAPHADFNNTDLCLVLGAKRNHLLVLNPRFQTGLIHLEKVEVLK